MSATVNKYNDQISQSTKTCGENTKIPTAFMPNQDSRLCKRGHMTKEIDAFTRSDKQKRVGQPIHSLY